MELKGKKIVFLGDSITEGVGASAYDKVYHQVLAKNCGAEAFVDGISGTRFAVQRVPSENPSFDINFISRVDALPDDADIVVVFGGTNDFGHGDAPFGKMSDRDGNTFYGACHTLMGKLVDKYFNKTIVFITPLHRECEDAHDEKTQNLGDFVDAIKEVAKYYSIPVLDMYKEGGICAAVKRQCEYYLADGLHPNDTGYAHIADKLEKFLKAL